MQVAVVTPYCDEPIEWLTQCHESVKRQRHPATHILVGDGFSRADEALGEIPPAECGERKSHVEKALERWERENNAPLSFPLNVEGVS